MSLDIELVNAVNMELVTIANFLLAKVERQNALIEKLRTDVEILEDIFLDPLFENMSDTGSNTTSDITPLLTSRRRYHVRLRHIRALPEPDEDGYCWLTKDSGAGCYQYVDSDCSHSNSSIGSSESPYEFCSRSSSNT